MSSVLLNSQPRTPASPRRRTAAIIATVAMLAIGLVSVVLPGTALAQTDTTPPVFNGMTFNVTSVDTTLGTAAAEATIDASDAGSGVGGYFVGLQAPDSEQQIGGGAPSSNDAARVLFPQYSDAGVWTVNAIYIWDVAGNETEYSTYLGNLPAGLPTLTVTGPEDILAPTIHSISLDRTQVEPSAGVTDIEVTVDMTDDLSGVSRMYLWYDAPTTSQQVEAFFYQPVDGVNTATMTFPSFPEVGTWTPSQIIIVDEAENSVSHSLRYGPDTLGISLPNIEVSGEQDVDPPVLHGIEFSETEIDVSTQSITITVTVDVTDVPAGPRNMGIYLVSPAGDEKFVQFDDLEVSNESSVVFYPGSTFGEWVISGIYIYDTAGNTATFWLSDGPLDGQVGFAVPSITVIDPNAPDFCGGEIVTVDIRLGQQATNGDDVILGSPGADVIHGRGGNDIICGLGGNDKLSGGPGDDTIYGGDGRDQLFGHAGEDVLRGEGGSDRIFAGNDNDTVYAGSGADRVYGGAGDDQIFGMGGRDRLYGDDGDDTIQGNSQSDIIYGGNGQDMLRGSTGKDVIYGGADNDALYGGDNTDTLYGESGSDVMHGQRGRDNCIGGGQPTDTYVSC